MSGAGTTISMIKSLKSNAQLLNRNNMFAQLKNINNRLDKGYTHIPMSKEDLALLRREELNQLNRGLLRRRIILFLIVIPVAIIIGVVLFLLVHALM